MTRAVDLQLAAELGVDAVGFVLVPKSARCVQASEAAQLRMALPASMQVVALFQDADVAFVRESINLLRPDCLQFHGEEAESYCASFGVPYMKAVSMQSPEDLPAAAKRFASARALLLDSHVAGGLGGTGHAFDWSAVVPVEKPIVLAGGLKPENVAEAIARVRPQAVDVSSGIEAKPGVKDSAKMRAFVKAVRAADS
jgi:phosphoribosylanthranilate isomerase